MEKIRLDYCVTEEQKKKAVEINKMYDRVYEIRTQLNDTYPDGVEFRGKMTEITMNLISEQKRLLEKIKEKKDDIW